MHHSKGRVARQAHVGIPDGLVEDEYGRRGFFGRVSHLYRTAPPVDWVEVDEDLRPAALHTMDMAEGTDWLTGRNVFLANADVRLAITRMRAAMPYFFRNADADEVLFVHQGAGRLETDFGVLAYRRGDYLVVPRGTVYRVVPSAPCAFLVIESRDEVELPDRGLLGKHALFDPDVINTPTPQEMEPWPDTRLYTVKVKRAGRVSNIVYPFHPINVVGWKGDLAVWQLNVEDIRPVMSERYHLPPTAHATFVMRNAVVCTFLPRGLETGDPTALRVPFYHSNIDFDEVLFYHDGDFFSRAGIHPGMVTFHPQGIHHGPQPQAVKAAATRERTSEQAVMVDTRNPLELTEAGRRVADPHYWKSWMTAGR